MTGINHLNQELKDIRNVLDIKRFINHIKEEYYADDENAFWDERKSTLLRAVLMYLYETKKGRFTFEMVRDLIRQYPVMTEKTEKTPLDVIFNIHMHKHPDSNAVREYRKFSVLGRKTKFTTAVSLMGILDKYEE